MSQDWSKDTIGLPPRIRVGHRFPHVLVRVVDGSSATGMSQLQFLNKEEWERLVPSQLTLMEWKESHYLTTTDLSAQIGEPGAGPCYSLALLMPSTLNRFELERHQDFAQIIQEVLQRLRNDIGIQIKLVEIRAKQDEGDTSTSSKFLQDELVSTNVKVNHHLVLEEVFSQMPTMLTSDGHRRCLPTFLCLIRPDGHVGCIHEVERSTNCLDKIDLNLKHIHSDLRAAIWYSLVGCPQPP
jgi:hypothetical protein